MKLQITIDGKAYAVDVELLEDEESEQTPDSIAHHVAQDATSGHAQGAHTQISGGTWDAETKRCTSPVMGLVIKIHVEPGQVVEAGALMLVLEAMKMETKVTTPRAAKVKSVHVKPGDPVKVDQLLVELE